MKGKLTTNGQDISAEIETSLNEASGFLNKIVPAFVKDAGGILNDQVRKWRYLNALHIVTNVKEKIEEKDYPVKQIPLKVLSPLLEGASLEEDQNLKEKWKNLLANAATGNKKVSPNYIEMLKELSPVEVAILDLVSNSLQGKSYKERKEFQFDKNKIAAKFDITSKEMDLIVENLYRLNIFQAPAGSGVQVGNYKFVLKTTDAFEMTSLGFAFIQACKFS